MYRKPFVVVYEPCGDGTEPKIESVRLLETGDDLVAVEVTLKNRQVITVLSSVNPGKRYRVGQIEFQGVYGVVAQDRCYLGEGTLLRRLK